MNHSARLHPRGEESFAGGFNHDRRWINHYNYLLISPDSFSVIISRFNLHILLLIIISTHQKGINHYKTVINHHLSSPIKKNKAALHSRTAFLSVD
jgi:hypothetical protein